MTLNITYPGGFKLMKSCINPVYCVNKGYTISNFGYSLSCCDTSGCNALNTAGKNKINNFYFYTLVLLFLNKFANKFIRMLFY